MQTPPAPNPKVRNLHLRNIPSPLATWLDNTATVSGRPIRVIVIDALILFQAALNGDNAQVESIVSTFRRSYQK